MHIVSLDNLKTFYDNIKEILVGKKDIEKLTLNTTDNSDNIYINSNEILSFNVVQTFTSKTFTLETPTDTTIENTYTIRFKLNSTTPTINFTVPSGSTLKWANNEAPTFNGNGSCYEITFKYMPGLNIYLGVCGEF